MLIKNRTLQFREISRSGSSHATVATCDDKKKIGQDDATFLIVRKVCVEEGWIENGFLGGKWLLPEVLFIT